MTIKPLKYDNDFPPHNIFTLASLNDLHMKQHQHPQFKVCPLSGTAVCPNFSFASFGKIEGVLFVCFYNSLLGVFQGPSVFSDEGICFLQLRKLPLFTLTNSQGPGFTNLWQPYYPIPGDRRF